MRKRNIKSVAHWVIMCFLFLFPLVMVGVSAFAPSQQEVEINYKYETNEVNSLDDLIQGNIYHFDNTEFYNKFSLNELIPENESLFIECISINDLYTDSDFITDDFYTDSKQYLNFFDSGYVIDIVRFISGGEYYLETLIASDIYYSCDFVFYNLNFDFTPLSENVFNTFLTSFSKCENIPIESVDVIDISLRNDINNWCNDFVNLPVNVWYGDLLNIIGIGLTDSALMTILYIYPLYVIWVYVLDLICDIMLIIVKLGHDLLEKLGANND